MWIKILDLSVVYDSFLEVEDCGDNIWDLLFADKKYYLVVDHINEYTKKIEITSRKNLWNLLSKNSIFFLLFFYKYWYSNTKRVMNLYIPDISRITKYSLPISTTKKKLSIYWDYFTKYTNFDKYYDYLRLWDQNIKIISYKDFTDLDLKINWQQLFEFPDLWTLKNVQNSVDIKNITLLHWWNTSQQKIRVFLDIKSWKVKNLFATHSQSFQDRKNLKNIFIFEPYKWYYKNHQNPRYRYPEVAKQIQFFYGVKQVFFICP